MLIAGGYDKHLDYTPLAKPILEHVSALILIGETSKKILSAVKENTRAMKILSSERKNIIEKLINE